MFSFIRRVRSHIMIVPLIALAIVFFAGWSSLSAQTSGPAWQEEPDDTMTEAMRRFLENREAVEGPSEAMGATPCDGGTAGSYPCDNIDLLTFMPLAAFSTSYINDMWGWTDPLDGKEYALVGADNGTVFIDVSDPLNPVYLGRLPTHTSSSTWRDLKVYNNYVFVVSEASGHGMQIFDLTELRNVVAPPVTFSNTDHYNGFGDAHNIVINEDSGYAYGVGTNTCSGGLHMVNIQDPLNATNAGCFSGDGYTHDAQCVDYIGPDTDYTGAEICFNSNTDTLTIVDVTNKNAPSQIAREGYQGVGYTHQGWLLDGQRYFLLGDEGDEFDNGHNTRTYIWDLLDLDNPVLMGNFTGPNDSVDHNVYVNGDYAYESNYSSGLQVMDLSDIANGNLSIAGFFDTYTPNNNASYNGSWSNYPYFPSGVIAVASQDEGLFLLQPTFTEQATLVTDRNEIEVSVGVGGSVMQTLVVSNTGTAAFDFTAAETAAWASITPDNGTLNPGESMNLTVEFDSTATPGIGDYTDAITFSGTFSNNPADVDLILHVTEAYDYSTFMPVVVGDGGGAMNGNATNGAAALLLPLIGLTAVIGISRRKK